MILVDVYIPSVDQNYNFRLNEEAEIQTVIREIASMVAQKEQTQLCGDNSELQLYNLKDKCVLPKKNTLSDCSVTSGTLLMLL